MADDRIEIEIVLDDGKIAKGFTKVRRQGKKTSEDLSKSFSLVTSRVTAFAGSLVGLFALRNLTRLSNEFGTSLAEIATITDDVAVSNGELAKSLINLSAQFGTRASEQAKSFYQIVSAGITDARQANEALVAANKLAIGGLTTTAGAIDLLTSAVNAFGQANLSATKAADIIFGTVRLGKTRVEELQSSLGQILPTAAALGVSFEDTAAALAQLTTRGVSTSEAVTQLNAVFTAVLKKQTTAKTLGEEVAKAFTLQALQTKGLTGFLRDLNIALGGSEERLVKLLGRAEGARAIITLAADSFVGLEDKVKQLNNSMGAADAAFEKIAVTTEQRLNRTIATAEAIFLRLSRTTGGPLNNALSVLNEQLREVLSAFDSVNSVGALAEGIFLNIARSALVATQNILNLFSKIAELIPGTATNFGKLAEAFAGEELQASIEAIEKRIGDLATTTKELDIPSPLPKFNEKLKTDLEATSSVINNVSQQINKALQSGILKSLSTVIQGIGASLVKGGAAFQDFGKAVLGIIGDMAIQIGTTLLGIGLGIDALKLSLATLTGGFAIAAGIALIAIGGALKALSGGAGGLAGAAISGGVGPQVAEEPGFEVDEEEDIRDQTAVTINVEGTIIDPKTTGENIAGALQEFFDSSGGQLVVNA